MTIACHLYGVRHTYLNLIRLPFRAFGSTPNQKMGPYLGIFFQSPQCCNLHNDATLPNLKLGLRQLPWLQDTTHIASNAIIFITMRNLAVTVHPVKVVSDSDKESLTIVSQSCIIQECI